MRYIALGADVCNVNPAGQDVFEVVSKGLANVYRADCFLATERLSAKARI
jgi:hypothetical protein